MTTCCTCGAYYRLTAFHKDNLNCEDCAYSGPKYIIDQESDIDIQQIIHPSNKTAAIRYDDDDN